MARKAHETRGRSIAKALSWRVVASFTSISLVYLFTGEIATALSFGAVEGLAKMVIYYLHERSWSAIDWGWKT